MPIKLPKGFQKRKSSGNALEELQNPPPTSFKVIERPGSRGKSFDGGYVFNAVGSAPRPPPKPSFDQGEEALFSAARPDAHIRSIGGTGNSPYVAPSGSTPSATRLNMSSANPSPLEARSDSDIQPQGQRHFDDIPVPTPSTARSGFLRHSGRTFSFGIGGKNHQASLNSSPVSPHPVPNQNFSSAAIGRDRAMTASSASTATPPKLFDSDLALENSELDNFGKMFDDFGLKSSREASPIRQVVDEPTSLPPAKYPPTSYPSGEHSRLNRAPAPRPIIVSKGEGIESSPYSWTSQDSRDGLMRSPSPSKSTLQASPQRKQSVDSVMSPQSPTTHRRLMGRKALARERNPENLPSETSTDNDGTGAKLSPVMSRTDNTSLKSNDSSAGLDPAFVASAHLAARFQETKPEALKPISTNKIMTRAQFERYKEQQERDRRLERAYGATDSGDEADSYEDDDDDDSVQRDREATKQRRKQEAHLSVYRQQMMKVTGEQPAPRSAGSLSNQIGRLGDFSSTEVDSNPSRFTMNAKQSGKNSSDDAGEEDEDVPLGILAAHGFPNKNRPPTRSSNSPSNSNLLAPAQQALGPPSGSGEPANRAGLPVFARNLPKDPYFGAGLVNPSNRESLAIHESPQLAPMPSGAATGHPVHPAGLVGVIAGEERARAMRRGSPNAQGGYDLPPNSLPRSQTTSSIPQLGFPGMIPTVAPMLSPGDQAQIQMSQQMTQMMQMQMQWMQQMQQMMGGQSNGAQATPSPMSPHQGTNLLAPPNAISRPHSMHMHSTPAPGHGQRTMSTLTPSMAPWNAASSGNGNGNYALSIAPSERSNVGLPPRYRPISTAQEPETFSARRASTFTSSTFKPWSSFDVSPGVPAHAGNPSINPANGRPVQMLDDDDDEQGWAEMKLKREKKQKTWKLRKGQNALQELYNGAS